MLIKPIIYFAYLIYFAFFYKRHQMSCPKNSQQKHNISLKLKQQFLNTFHHNLFLQTRGSEILELHIYIIYIHEV